MKRIAIIPTLLTLGNGVCGFVAITYASKVFPGVDPALVSHYFAMTGWFIVFAMVFDMLDGYVARLSKTASKFGGELDSLCDAISFGVAPAFLLLKIGPGWEKGHLLHQLLAGIATLYMVCTILRLARFNVDNTPDPASHKRFRGLPSPGAAGCLASLAIFRGEFPGEFLTRLLQSFGQNPDALPEMIQRFVEFFAPMGGLVVALLMVSVIPYPHVTKQVIRGRRHVGHLIQVLLAAFIVVLIRELALLLIFWIYAVLFPLRSFLMRNTNKDQPPVSNPRLDEGHRQ